VSMTPIIGFKLGMFNLQRGPYPSLCQGLRQSVAFEVGAGPGSPLDERPRASRDCEGRDWSDVHRHYGLHINEVR
jgi:hypothetical protein